MERNSIMSIFVLCRRFCSSARNRITVRPSSSRATQSSSTKVGSDLASAQISIDEETIKHLERLSLVDFANKRGIERLEEAIKFADKLSAVKTSEVEPLVTVLEDEILTLRDDEVTEDNDVQVVMSTASQTEEDYYVAPPGNIPLNSRDLNQLK